VQSAKRGRSHSLTGRRGGSVKAAGLGDGPTPGSCIAPHAAGKSSIARLRLTLPRVCQNILTARPSAGAKYPLAKSAKSAEKASMERPFNLGDLCVFARGITSPLASPYRRSQKLSAKNFQFLRVSSTGMSLGSCLDVDATLNRRFRLPAAGVSRHDDLCPASRTRSASTGMDGGHLEPSPASASKADVLRGGRILRCNRMGRFSTGHSVR